MKLLFPRVVLGALLSCSHSVAFTSPQSPLLCSPPVRTTATKLQQSTLIEGLDAVSVQPTKAPQLIEEEQYVSPASLDASAAAETDSKSYLDDGFVFGLDGSGLERPRGKVASLVYEGDSVETTPLQLGVVSATIAGHAAFGAFGIHTLLAQMEGNILATALIAAATIVSSWIASDFGSGVLHWSVDNYGNGRTPIMGNIIAAFQGHHSAPWTITYRGFANNVWKLCIPFGLPTVGLITYLAGPQNPMVSLFFAVFCFCEIMSQEFHKWSHQTKKEVPGWINTLQDVGMTIGRVPHAQHHIAPYDGNYCIVSGFCNRRLDESGFFRWLEHRVYEINGVESNSWKLDPKLRTRTLAGDYALPKKLRRKQ